MEIRPIFKRVLLMNFMLILILFSCRNEKDKSRFKHSYKICNHLFIEMYTVAGGGAYGGDIVSDYLTDSLTFRKFMGVHDSANEAVVYSCSAEQIYLERFSVDGRERKLIKKDSLSIKDLKKEHVFE